MLNGEYSAVVISAPANLQWVWVQLLIYNTATGLKEDGGQLELIESTRLSKTKKLKKYTNRDLKYKQNDHIFV